MSEQDRERVDQCSPLGIEKVLHNAGHSRQTYLDLDMQVAVDEVKQMGQAGVWRKAWMNTSCFGPACTVIEVERNCFAVARLALNKPGDK